MAPNVSKNAKTARGSKVKNVIEHNGREIEVCPAKLYGKFAGMKDGFIVEDKTTRTPLLDKNGIPLSWAESGFKIKKKEC